jgi:RNA polymerase sigma-70 factor (ECF subfamily)
MRSDEDLPALVGDAALGDREAFGELYGRYSRAVHGVLIARLPREDAEDVLQEVFMHAFAHLKDLREPAAFGGWICAIARRRAIDHHRRAYSTLPLVDDVAASDQPDVTTEAHGALDAIQALPEAYRETLVLRLVEGLTGPEIASLTGLTPDSVRVNLHRGFRLLRERLGVAS